MKEKDIALLMKGMAPVIGQLISKSVEQLVERIAELEQQIADMPVPKDGRDGVDGKDGADGRDGVDGVPGHDGKDADPMTAEQIAEAVADYLAANPPAAGKDGRDGKDGAAGVDGKDGADGVDGKDGADGRNGADGKDGVGLADAIIDRKGVLVLTMTDGRVKDLDVVVGRDGADGDAGKDGAPGRDGFGFDGIDLVEGDEGVSIRFLQGEVSKEFALPVVFDRGVYREGGSYRKGNGVTWGGSYWIAQKDDPGKPDTPDSGWRLAVKKGQNGRDAERKA